jgi:hypothetical protein
LPSADGTYQSMLVFPEGSRAEGSRRTRSRDGSWGDAIQTRTGCCRAGSLFMAKKAPFRSTRPNQEGERASTMAFTCSRISFAFGRPSR